MTTQPQPHATPPAMAQAAGKFAVPVTAPASARRLLLVLGTAMLACSACVGLACALSGFTGMYVAGEQGNLAVVLDDFMLAMAAKDAEHAHGLFAAGAQSSEVRAGLENTLAGAAFALYSGYRRLELSTTTIGLQSGSDPYEPHGIVAQVSGVIRYTDGFLGNFDATLVKEQGTWKLWNVNIELAPERIDGYLDSQP